MIYKGKANAKINIGLQVLNKRKDGYHNIETIFYPIKLYDNIKLKIEKSDKRVNKILVSTNIKELNSGNNICVKAIRNFLNFYEIKDKYIFDIDIIKSIPVGAGLGGGSSDAALILKLLSRYFKLSPKLKKDLIYPAINTGSDVPFFLINKPCHASLRGEKLKPIKTFKIKYKILLVNPSINISTSAAYQALDKVKRKYIRLDKVKNFTLSKKELFSNDFESIIFDDHPEIKEIKNIMYLYNPVFSSMSGSGSSVYGFFKERKMMSEAKKEFIKMKYKVFEV